MYKEFLQTIECKLATKEEQLKQKLEYFEVFFYNEKHTMNFERNAINDLLVMKELKTEIHELKNMKMLLELSINKE